MLFAIVARRKYVADMHLRDFKAREGLSLTALAGLLGRPVSTVHAWLNDDRRPDRASMQAIARVTDGAVTANDFHDLGAPPGLAEAQAPFQAGTRAERDRIGAEKARRWAAENAEAIAVHTRTIEDNDTPLAKYRMF